jgi:asparagine synthase (glutamine-hydrolysing)
MCPRYYTARTMCGIAGVVKVWATAERERALQTPHVHAIPEAWLDILDDSIRHRGPDGLGRFRDRAIRADGCVVDVAFVHRRLSIIDHAGGHQPMLSLGKGRGVVTGVKRYALGDGLGLYERDAASELAVFDASRSQAEGAASETNADRVCVIFNGCIYNHRELRGELQKAGHVFSTDHSDTEVLVHGWREWRLKLFDKLEGMYAINIWSGSDGCVVSARDAFGEKPLFVSGRRAQASGYVRAFASTHAALLRLTTLDPHIFGQTESASISSWLENGFCNLMPLRFDTSTLEPGMWCQLSARSVQEHLIAGGGVELSSLGRSTPTDAAAVEAMLDASVRSRIESDVPLGVFLSGGVDSSLIATLAKKATGSCRTFSVRMPDPLYDESVYAESVARVVGAQHTTLECQPRPADDVVRLIEQIGLPLGDSSLLPTAWVSQAAASHVRVALGGDGGDELFAGYERYRAVSLLKRFRPWLSSIAGALPATRSPKTRLSKLQRLAEAARSDGYLELLRIFGRSDLNTLMNYDPEPKHPDDDETGVVREIWTIEQAIAWDLQRYLPQDLLCKVDSASMAAPLEVRSPFLDRTLARAALSAPISCLMPHNQRKGLLRQLARKYLPAEIVDRPKMGFAIPIGEWFRSDYGGLRTMLLDHLNSAEPFGSPSLGIELNMNFVRQMLDEHLGTGPSGRVVRDHSQRLYMLLVLSIWSKWLSQLR